jgi:hypothetical protein
LLKVSGELVMLSNKAALAAIGVVALVGASAAGTFLASRHADQAAPTVQGAEATEAVIEEPPAAPAVVAAAEPVGTPTPVPASRPPVKAVPETPRRREVSRPAETAQAPRARPQSQQAPAPPAPRPVDTQERVASRPPTQEPVETVPVTDVPVAREDHRPAQAAPLPTLPQLEDVTVPADAVIGLQLESSLSSDTARVEDRVEARVTRDVRADGRVAIPAGSRVLGSVSVVERGGKMRERARLGVRFHTVILADGTELALQTETVLREGESPGNASAAKVGGGAIGGAILGAILGGGKGAAIGAGVGAGAGTAAVMAGGRRPAQIQAGSPMTVKVLSPVTVSVEK